MFGFGFGKDESFFRWLFLERARLHKLMPELTAKTWFVDTGAADREHRRPFFEGLGMKVLTLPLYSDIYENQGWQV